MLSLLLLALPAFAEPVEAVVFPGNEVSRVEADTRLAAMRALAPPPKSISVVGPRLRLEVAPDQVAALVGAGWVVVVHQKVRDVAEVDAIVAAAWGSVPTATVVVDFVETSASPVRLRSAEGVEVEPGRVPAGSYLVLVDEFVFASFEAAPETVVRLECSTAFRRCLVAP